MVIIENNFIVVTKFFYKTTQIHISNQKECKYLDLSWAYLNTLSILYSLSCEIVSFSWYPGAMKPTVYDNSFMISIKIEIENKFCISFSQ